MTLLLKYFKIQNLLTVHLKIQITHPILITHISSINQKLHFPLSQISKVKISQDGMTTMFIITCTDKLEKAMAPHSSTLAWKTPWTEEHGRLQSMGSLRVGHNWETSLSLFTCMHWRRKWPPTPVFLSGESQGQGSLVGCRLWGHTQSRTWLKQLSSSSKGLLNWHNNYTDS